MQECCHNDNSATNSVDMSSWVFRKCSGYFGVLGIVLKMYTQFFDNILGFGQYHKISKITWKI